MAGYGRRSAGHKGKRGGLVGNLAKLGGSHSKLRMAGDMRGDNIVSHMAKKAAKQAHKRA